MLPELRNISMKEGSKNRPPHDAAGPDQQELAIKNTAESYLTDEQRLFDAVLIEASRDATNGRQKIIQHQLAVEQLLSDSGPSGAVNAELAEERADLVKATAERLSAQAEIQFFRASHGIHEAAVYPESKIWHFGIIFGLAVIEMVANAFFFENSQGLLGGLFVAAGIAFLNMGSALMLGAGFRYKNLAGVDKKLLGWGCLALFVVVAIFCNALFASFRSEYQLVVDPSEPTQVSEAFMRAWPQALSIFRFDMQLKDQTSFILFGFGLILSIFAFIKGYGIDDRHPGYGVKDRRFNELVTKEQNLLGVARQKVKDLLHRRRAAVQAAINEPNTQAGMLGRRVADLKHAVTTLNAQANAIERDYGMVVGAYRDTNTSVRATEAPAFFKEPPVLSVKVDAKHANAVAAELAKAQEELKQAAAVHKDALTKLLSDLDSQTSVILKDTMDKFQADVLRDGSDVVAASTPVIHRVKPA